MSEFYGKAKLSLTLKAPFLIAGAIPVTFGVDIAQIRNFHGFAVIPDTHIKGVLRHAWDYRNGGSTAFSADDLFGKGGDAIDNIGGRIWFTDLVAPQGEKNTPPITRMSIDPETGAAKSGALFVIEQIAKPGATVCFTGEVTIRTRDMAQAQAILDEFTTALKFVSSIGKFKTSGFGRLVDHGAGDLQEIVRPKAKTFTAGQYELSFQVNKPLLTDTVRPDGNMFSGSEIITGGTIKGALAAKLKASGLDSMEGDLGDALSMMTISHAFPGRVDAHDLALDHVEAGTEYIRFDQLEKIDYTNETDIPRFAPDYKRRPKRKYLDREFRTHVAIDPSTGSARDAALFSTSSVVHEYKVRPVEWRTKIEFSDNATPAQLAAFNLCMNELAHGLFSLGKTKARTLAVNINSVRANSAQSAPTEWRLVLDTPLLMLREYHLSSEALYWAAIRKYWNKATNGCYELKSCNGLPEIYAQQSYASGYPALKFPFFGPKRIEPFVLTRPGSVFVLSCINKDTARAERLRLEREGLPVAKWTPDDPLTRQGDCPGCLELLHQPDFRDCPFGRQNGYGQIRTEGAP